MALVEDTANYLDGEGREVAKGLSREASMSYAGSSMRLTTQLMQIASWLLVLRAVREDEMTVGEASDKKYRLDRMEMQMDEGVDCVLPDRLRELIIDARMLYDRIQRLDVDLFCVQASAEPAADAISQQRALQRAFGS